MFFAFKLKVANKAISQESLITTTTVKEPTLIVIFAMKRGLLNS